MVVEEVSGLPLQQLVSLKGRTAVVTGGAQGLGKAMVRRLAEAGANVLVGDLKVEAAQATASEIAQRYGAKVIAAHLDVTDTTTIKAAADLAASEFGGLDIWVNNAGLYPNVLLAEMTDEIWDQTMAVNLRGVFASCQEAASRMIAGGTKGVLINVVSTAGFKGVAPGMAAYVASKHGVRGLNKQLALELAPHAIRVLGVAPTFCETEGNMAALAELPDRVRSEISATLTSALGRVGVPDDIARVVLFAASDLSLFMTGSTILVDAGETA